MNHEESQLLTRVCHHAYQALAFYHNEQVRDAMGVIHHVLRNMGPHGGIVLAQVFADLAAGHLIDSPTNMTFKLFNRDGTQVAVEDARTGTVAAGRLAMCIINRDQAMASTIFSTLYMQAAEGNNEPLGEMYMSLMDTVVLQQHAENRCGCSWTTEVSMN